MALCSAVVVLLGLLAGCRTPPVEDPLPVLDGPGRVSFESLGWTEDALITSGSNNAKVRFLLPDDAAQAKPLWYGARIAYEWTGNPGAAGSGGEVGDHALLVGELEWARVLPTAAEDLVGSGRRLPVVDGGHGQRRQPRVRDHPDLRRRFH